MQKDDNTYDDCRLSLFVSFFQSQNQNATDNKDGWRHKKIFLTEIPLTLRNQLSAKEIKENNVRLGCEKKKRIVMNVEK